MALFATSPGARRLRQQRRSDDADGGGTAAQNVAAGALEATWPLTGLPVTGDDEAAQKHPVMVLKMDNTDASAPQVGLGRPTWSSRSSSRAG